MPEEIEPIDLTSPRYIQIRISRDRKTIWINTEKECIFRACKIGKLDIDDLKEIKSNA
jgi:hypothetical protein